MFTLAFNPSNRDLAVRPICKEKDRSLVREIFRKEFYGSALQSYPDEGLWEIYDSMEANQEDVFGAYLVSYLDRPLFLLEIHPPVQMDLPAAQLADPGTVGIYCFYTSIVDPMNLPGFHTCIGSLLDYPGIDYIVTTNNNLRYEDPRVGILQRSGFTRLSGNPNQPTVYRCTQLSFPLLCDTSGRFASLFAH